MSRSSPCLANIPCCLPSSGIAPSQLPRCGEATRNRSAAKAGVAMAQSARTARCRAVIDRARSVIVDAEILERPAPARRFPAHEERELVGRAGLDIAAARLRLLLDRRIVEDAHDLAIELVDDRAWGAPGRNQAEPYREVVELLEPGGVAQQRHAAERRHDAPVETRERAHLTGLDQRYRDDRRRIDEIDAAREQALHGLGCPLERNVDDVEAHRLVKQMAHELGRDGAAAEIER